MLVIGLARCALLCAPCGAARWHWRSSCRHREQSLGLVLHDERIENALDDYALGRIELPQRLELEFEGLIGTAFV